MAHNWSNIKSDKLQLNTKTGNFWPDAAPWHW